MARIEKLLVGVDLHHGDRLASQELGVESQAAVAEALGLATIWGGTITFCSVLELSAQSQSLVEHDRESIFKTVEGTANEVLAQLVNQATLQGISCKSMLRFGTAWEELTKESSSGEYDLVVIGSRSKARAARILLGGTSHKLMRYSPCPIWVVKPAELREVRDIAIATDLSPSSLSAFHVAVTVARAINARLHVIHVVETSDFRYLLLAGVAEEEMIRTEARLMKEAVESVQDQLHKTDFRTLLHGVKIEVMNGTPDSEILRFVDANSIDLLVIGTHGHSGFSGMFLGNTAERLLPGLHASLLAVKPTDFVSPYENSPKVHS